MGADHGEIASSSSKYYCRGSVFEPELQQAADKGLRRVQMPELEMDEIKEALTANDFSKARRLLETFLTAPGVDSKKLTWARQKLALSTYKDKETQSEVALEKALQALEGEGLEDSTDPETLGLAGAVHKRLWEINGNLRELTWSLGYYE